jgi:hypothetical protein
MKPVFDELYDELVYTEAPSPDRIGEFVSQSKISPYFMLKIKSESAHQIGFKGL